MATAAQRKAERIAAEQEARTVAYQKPTNPYLSGEMATGDAYAAAGDALAIEAAEMARVKTAAEEAEAARIKAVADAAAAEAARIKKEKEDAAAAKVKYDKEQAAIVKKAQDEAEKRDAFALVQDTMRSYGFDETELKELSTFIESSIIDPNVGPNMAILNMRNLPAYKKRFSANDVLVKAGKNSLSEYDYLQQENAYDEYFKAYGVGNLSTRTQKATLIGGSVSALEVEKRLNLAVKRVQNSDPEILKQLKTYFPTITDKDLVSYFLNPEVVRPELERKVTASEISSAAIGQGFTGGTSMSALGLADYGVDRAGALEGYANLAGVLPEATKLGNIYSETGIKYTQQTGEEEFLQSSDAAKRKRNVLASKERANFEGSAGNAPGAYSTSYLKKSSAAGQI